MSDPTHHGRTAAEIQATTLPKALQLWMQAGSHRDRLIRAAGLDPRTTSIEDAVDYVRALAKFHKDHTK